MKKLDYALLISVLVISIFGSIMIYSSSYIWAEYKYNDAFKFVKNQVLFLVVGIILMIIISRVNYNIYYKKATLILLICISLLILVLIPGIGTVRNGSRSWFGIGSFGIQPSEFTKLGLIIFVSKYLTKNEKSVKDIKKGVLPVLGLLLLVFGLIMLQPDFGTGSIILMTIIGILFVAGVSFKFFLKIGLVGVIAISILIIIAPYRLSKQVYLLGRWSWKLSGT